MRRPNGILLAIFGAVASLWLSGCVAVDLRAGFTEVSETVGARLGVKPTWNNGTELDRAADEKLRELLRAPLNADAAVQIALLNNRELQALYSDLGVAQADLVQAGLLRNPIFNAAVMFPVTGGRPDLELSVVMSFLDILYLPLRQRVAAARFDAAKSRVVGAVMDLAGQTRAAFYAHQANEQLVDLRRTILQSLDAAGEITQRLYDAGNISALDLLRERALAGSARLQLRGAELAARQSRELLNIRMGVWGGQTAWRNLPRLPEIPAAQDGGSIEQLAVTRSLYLVLAQQNIAALGEQLGFDKASALIPELTLGGSAEREASWQVGPVIELPIPLFDQGQGRVARAAAELRRAQQEYYALAVRMRAEARAAQERFDEARERALYYRDILLPLHERIVNETQLHYNAMQLGPVQLLRAREQQIEVAVGYVEALRDHWLAHNDMEQIAAGRLAESSAMKNVLSKGQPMAQERQGH
ncbi:MAG: TolC family protein [Deltaproteobacteria bacterium]|nr:TolC family protein [Deltaproteobacteria bacterium]